MFHGGIIIHGYRPELPRFHGGRKCQRVSKESSLRVAGLYELRSLGNVFAKDEFWLELVVEACFAKDGNGSAAVWGVVRICDGYFLDARVLKNLQTCGRVEG